MTVITTQYKNRLQEKRLPEVTTMGASDFVRVLTNGTSRNITLQTLLDALLALGYEPQVTPPDPGPAPPITATDFPIPEPTDPVGVCTDGTMFYVIDREPSPAANVAVFVYELDGTYTGTMHDLGGTAPGAASITHAGGGRFITIFNNQATEWTNDFTTSNNIFVPLSVTHTDVSYLNDILWGCENSFSAVFGYEELNAWAPNSGFVVPNYVSPSQGIVAVNAHIWVYNTVAPFISKYSTAGVLQPEQINLVSTAQLRGLDHDNGQFFYVDLGGGGFVRFVDDGGLV